MNRKILAGLSLVVVFAMLFAFAGCGAKTEEETTTTINVKTPLPTDITSTRDDDGNIVTDTEYSPENLAKNNEEIFAYFTECVNKIKTTKAAVEMSQSKSISKAVDEKGDSVKMSDNEYINAAITSLDDYMLHGKKDSLEYGDDIIAFIPVKGADYVSALELNDIESATCVDNGTERVVTVTLKSPAAVEVIQKAYDVDSVDEAMTEFEKANGYMELSTPELTYKNCQIIIKLNIETDEVTSAEFIKTMDVNTTVTGKGKLESIGTVPVLFNLRVADKYTFDYADPATSTTLAEM